MNSSSEMNNTVESTIDTMGKTLFDRFMNFVELGDVETSKALMDEWIVDGKDPEDGGVEFIWVQEEGQ